MTPQNATGATQSDEQGEQVPEGQTPHDRRSEREKEGEAMTTTAHVPQEADCKNARSDDSTVLALGEGRGVYTPSNVDSRGSITHRERMRAADRARRERMRGAAHDDNA